MGIYTAALNIGSFLTSMTTAPLAAIAGWQFALGSVAVLAVVAIAFWTLAVGVRSAFLIAPDDGSGTRLPPVAGARWTTAGLTAGFAGQAFSYYGVTAWLPTILSDELGMAPSAAGAGSSLFQILAIAGSLGVPLAARFASPTAVTVALGAMWLPVPLGLLLAPQWWWLWSSVGGVAQGGGITLIFIAIIKIARDQASAGRMSAVVQGAGYAIGAAAPPLLGYLHGTTGSWTVPMLLVLGSVLTFFGCTTLSVRRVPKGR